MRKRLYAEISTSGVCIHTPRKGKGGIWEAEHIPLPSGLFDTGEIIASETTARDIISSLKLPRYKSFDLVLIANMRKTVIRIVEIPQRKRNTPIKPAAQWELVCSAFPLGERMNERTYVFDGCEFANEKGEARFFMVALPVEVSDIIAQIGEAIVGSPYRLTCIDTIEHIILRKYIPKPISKNTQPVQNTTITQEDELLILLPQDDGLRILHIQEGLPQTAHYISNNPSHRSGELLRCMQGIQQHNRPFSGDTQGQHAPASACISYTSKKTTPIRAVFLYNKPEHIAKWQWLQDSLHEMGIPTEETHFSPF